MTVAGWWCILVCFFFSSRRRHTRCSRDWSSDVCSSDLFSGDGIHCRENLGRISRIVFVNGSARMRLGRRLGPCACAGSPHGDHSRRHKTREHLCDAGGKGEAWRLRHRAPGHTSFRLRPLEGYPRLSGPGTDSGRAAGSALGPVFLWDCILSIADGSAAVRREFPGRGVFGDSLCRAGAAFEAQSRGTARGGSRGRPLPGEESTRTLRFLRPVGPVLVSLYPLAACLPAGGEGFLVDAAVKASRYLDGGGCRRAARWFAATSARTLRKVSHPPGPDLLSARRAL